MENPTIIIAGCGKLKADTSRGPVPAQDLYVGGLAAPRAAYVAERARVLGVPWRILSAHYGLLNPEQPVTSYNVTLDSMRAHEREAFAKRLSRDLEWARWTRAQNFARVEVHAGAVYADVLERALEIAHIESVIDRPVTGMFMGQQRAFYLKALEGLRQNDAV